MYVTNNQAGYGGLGQVWGLGEKEDKGVDPEEYLPKPKERLSATQAALVLTGKKEKKEKLPPKDRPAGDFYWTSSGIEFSGKPIPGAGKAEIVQMPKVEKKIKTRIVRDLPVIKNLSGIGNLENSTILLGVLGLLIFGVIGYNRR